MTNTITTAPAAAPKKGGKRKIAVGVGIGAALLVGVLIGKTGGSTAEAAAPLPAPAPVTITAKAPPAVVLPPVKVTVTADAPPPVTVTADAPAPVTVTEAPAAPVVVGPAEEITKSGVYVVGTDIKAGKWKSDGKINPARSSGYFAILNDPSGSTSDVDNIITNENPDGQAFATLVDGQGFDVSNLHWILVG